MDFSAKLSLPYLLPNQAQKHVTLNDSLRRLDAIVQLSVISSDLTTPPDNPEEGDRYLRGSRGQKTNGRAPMARWPRFRTAPGHSIRRKPDGSSGTGRPRNCWSGTASPGSIPAAQIKVETPEMLGINTSHRTAITGLSVRSAASLLSHEGAGHQLKINKASAADTASVLFQTGWSGRAEIGLTGSDDFSSENLTGRSDSFRPTLMARSSDGFVGIGTWSPTAPLHVAGAIRVGVVTDAELPDAEEVGGGALLFVETSGGSMELIYSDGATWRWVRAGVYSG